MGRSNRNDFRQARRIKGSLAASASASFEAFLQAESDRKAHDAASAYVTHRETHGESGDYRGTRDVMGVARHAARTIAARQRSVTDGIVDRSDLVTVDFNE